MTGLGSTFLVAVVGFSLVVSFRPAAAATEAKVDAVAGARNSNSGNANGARCVLQFF